MTAKAASVGSKDHMKFSEHKTCERKHQTGRVAHLGRQGLGGGFKGRPHGVILHSPQVL